jgi:hypothetical protein
LFLSSPADIVDNPAAPDPSRSDERVVALKELADRAMDMARMIHSQAQEAFAAGQPVDDLRFTRVARAVRQIFALEAHLEEDIHTRAELGKAQRAEALERDHRRQVGARSEAVRAKVEDAIRQESSGPYAVALEYRLYDWLDRRSDREDFLTRPIDDIIAAIKRDIGLTEVEEENAEIEALDREDEDGGLEQPASHRAEARRSPEYHPP